MNALGVNQKYKGNPEEHLNYTFKIPQNYEDFYQKALQNGDGYNPMDALEKNFKARGLDKKYNDLYKKIVKYKNILEKPEGKENKNTRYILYAGAVICCGLLAIAGAEHYKNKKE